MNGEVDGPEPGELNIIPVSGEPTERFRHSLLSTWLGRYHLFLLVSMIEDYFFATPQKVAPNRDALLQCHNEAKAWFFTPGYDAGIIPFPDCCEFLGFDANRFRKNLRALQDSFAALGWSEDRIADEVERRLKSFRMSDALSR